jgi:nucleotide-binding universal stress UspA family protein
MELPKRILVAVDFTPTADRALDYAIDLAKPLGASVVVVHAYEIPVIGFPDATMIATADVAARLSRASQAALEAMVAKRSACGVPLEPELRCGVVWEEIHAVAQAHEVDLIVVGTHGRRGLSRALLGSVAENIIRTSTRPVLVLHETEEDKAKSAA